MSFQSEQQRPTKGTHTPQVVLGGVELGVGMRLRCVTAVVAQVQVRGKTRVVGNTPITQESMRTRLVNTTVHTHASASPVSNSGDDVGWWRESRARHTQQIAPYTDKEHDGRTARGCSHIGGVASGIGWSGA